MVLLHRSRIHIPTIAWLLNRHISTVGRWISRVRTNTGIQDRKRTGRPAIYSEATKLKTIAFYCQVSPLPGCNTWSFRWAQKYLKDHNEVLDCSLSHSTIHRILNNHALRPHMHRYFLSITDPDFFPKMDHVIDFYLHPPKYLFCFDECPGIQANTPLVPELPPAPHKPVYDDFHYRRNGTTDLLAFLDTQKGMVMGRCTQNHTTSTLVRVFREHVSLFPVDATLHYIMDNLNTHFHDEFCRTVADLSHVSYHPLKTGAQRRMWLQMDNKRIVIHFIPFHGSWLNMIEIWFGILSKKCLKHQPFQSVPFMVETILESIGTWNTLFAHPFRWHYTGKDLHEKAISRFNTYLLNEHKLMDTNFLTKQLQLMSNIAQRYTTSVGTTQWQQLAQLITSKQNYINGILDSEVNEKKRTKAGQALDVLQASL